MSLYVFFYFLIWKKTGEVYDWFLPAGKLHRQSREAREKSTTSCHSSSCHPPGTRTHSGSTTCSWGYGWKDSASSPSPPPTMWPLAPTSTSGTWTLGWNQASSIWCGLAHSVASQMRTQMHICRIFWSSATLLLYGVSLLTLSSFVCFPFSLLGKAK